MVWIYLTLGIGVLALVAVGWYGYRLFRLSAATLGELTVLADRAAEALDLAAALEIPDRLGGHYDARFPLDDDDESDDESRMAEGSRRQT